jgi:ribonuclease HI
MTSEIRAVYADGGVIRKNPSLFGGTWAWCAVATDLRVVEDATEHIVASESGLLLPARVGVELVSNNHAEYFALAKALRALPEGWSGTVYSDSAITLGRFFSGWRNENLPEAWVQWSARLVARLGAVEWVLLDGHPTRAQLASGLGKRGNPCSTFNVWCDVACSLEARAFTEAREAERVAA